MSKKRVKQTRNKQADKSIRNKINLLVYADTPTCATGFGTVSRNILAGIQATGRYSITILGINYWGTPHDFPYRIWPTGTNKENDPYGRQKVMGMIPSMEFDLIFFLQDSFILNFLPQLIPHLRTSGKPFKSICYFPIDGKPHEQWVKNVTAVDYPVVYSEFGKEQCEQVWSDCPELNVIPHGVNTNEFTVKDSREVLAFRKQFFDKQADKFIFTNLNRNQQRKDIPRTIAAFKKFHEIVPNSALYLHMARKDQGWDLPLICDSYGLNTATEVIFPENFGPNQGYPREIVNLIYNASDCILSTTLGEGWGLSWIEAMATKTPVLMPGNTALLETITEDRGYLIKSGADISHHTVVPHDNEVVRPLVDVNDMVDKMLHIYHNQDEAAQKAENAYNWVHNEMDWQKHIVPMWIKVFDAMYNELIVPHKQQNTFLEDQIVKNNVIEAEVL
jgi:D-inositol-3-phosphate glycosyltransferase